MLLLILVQIHACYLTVVSIEWLSVEFVPLFDFYQSDGPGVAHDKWHTGCKCMQGKLPLFTKPDKSAHLALVGSAINIESLIKPDHGVVLWQCITAVECQLNCPEHFRSVTVKVGFKKRKRKF